MALISYNESYRDQWDAYVLQKADATIFHTVTWKEIIEDVYGLQSKYVMTVDENRITGILPLFFVAYPGFGKKLLSMPYSVLGGICADTRENIHLLLSKAIEMSAELNVDYLVLRQKEPVSEKLVTDDHYYTFPLKLDSDPEKIFSNIHRKSRRCINIALKEDWQFNYSEHDIREFYHIYSIGQKDFGTPVVSYNWIQKTYDAFPDNHRIAKLTHNGKTIAAMIVREFKGTIYPTIGHSLKEYRNVFPQYLLYWKTIEDACLKGLQYYDFGRSIQSSGTYKFKQRWGAEPTRLHYQYYLHRRKTIPDYSQSSSKRTAVAKVWRKLPLPITQFIGPPIRKLYP